MATLDLNGIFAVPPLPRRPDSKRTLDLDAAEEVARHVEAGGITRFLYGGNAFLYHATLGEFEALAGWLGSFAAPRQAIPGIGPSFGRAMEQARILRGVGAPVRCIPLIIYLMSDDAFGPDRGGGLDAIARLIDDRIAIAIKYAVVRDDPSRDPYLDDLLRRVDRAKVISGMGERPAIVHLFDVVLGGLTTGSGCIAPRRCQELFEAARRGDRARAEALRALFMPLEDLRDAWGPARVLHHATALAGIAPTGPIPPFVSALTETQIAQLTPVARTLKERGAEC